MTQYEPVIELSQLDGHNGFQIIGKVSYARIGRPVATAGDINGDGYADLIVTSDRASYVIFGKSSHFHAMRGNAPGVRVR